jgi:ABC-type transporter lipoprotein component MlaA/predicted alpha/beta-hydrolase family hydrolase
MMDARPNPLRAHWTRGIARLLLTAAVCGIGCAHTVERNDWGAYHGPGREYFLKEEVIFPEVPDPLEPFNRSMGQFNYWFLRGLVDPLSTGWRWVMPQPARDALVRAINNIRYPVRLVNNLLQGKWSGAGRETQRFLLNTTLGFGGLFDVARSGADIRPSVEDMGQTFGSWGWHDSTYLQLPLLGPSSFRDGLGTLGDVPLDPSFWVFPAVGYLKSFFLAAEQVDGAMRLIRTQFDAYHLVRKLWVLNRRVLTSDFEYLPPEEGAATDTLQSVFLDFHDPWFPSRARTRRVEIPMTGGTLRYKVWLQRDPAPIVFILPGLGGHRDARSSNAIAEMVFDRGFSAVTISSAYNFDFMETASVAQVPGYTPTDAHDVHRALDFIARDIELRHPDRMQAKALMGLSMGGFHTFYIAAREQDPENDLVAFDRYLALYPPVRLDYGVKQLDAYYNAPLVFPAGEREERAAKILQKVVAMAAEHDLEPGNPIPLSRVEAEFLIGVAFRLTVHDIILSSQNRTDMGVLQTERSSWRRSSASREILEFSFMEYFYAFVLPYYQKLDPTINSPEDFFERSRLGYIESELRANDKIRVFSTKNDMLLTDADIAWLADVLGEENVTFYPRGGHLGNLHEAEIQADVMEALADLHAVPVASR